MISPERDASFLQASTAKSKTPKQSDKSDKQEDKNVVDTNIPGGELYYKLRDFLKERLENIAQVSVVK